ncbi:MAG: hypothetical protein GYA51_03315 [Candidatus Methanofastidiosa archaeon]|jgi:hypothetical protein|nr:hypothetical protein [Candidatus Methanofastidiosa archaeon]
MDDYVFQKYMEFLRELYQSSNIKLAVEGYDLKYLSKRITSSKIMGINELFYKYGGTRLKDLFNTESIKKLENIMEQLNK